MVNLNCSAKFGKYIFEVFKNTKHYSTTLHKTELFFFFVLFVHSFNHHCRHPHAARQTLQRRFSEIQLDKSYRQESIREHPPVHFQKRREKSARVLITIVLTFLFCHTFRFVLKAYEVTHPSHSTPEHHVYCQKQER